MRALFRSKRRSKRKKRGLKKSFSEKRPDANVINITEEVTPDGEGAFCNIEI